MQEENDPAKKQLESAPDKSLEQPHKHNPFEDKGDHLTREEEDGIEEFKEAQTERD